jgi:hypothetical protein
VKQMLARAGVDWHALTITEETITARCWADGDAGFGPWETYTQVRISGPKLEQNTAWWALMARGLSCAPYPEYSLWSKAPNRKARAA